MAQFIRYVITGSCVYWIQIFLIVVLTEMFGLWYNTSFIIALCVGWISSFFVHKYITFRCKKLKNIMMVYFLLVLLAIYALWFGLQYVLTLYFPAHYMITLIASSLPSSLIGYIINKRYIFKKQESILYDNKYL